jgi:hypothetical protein
VAQLSNRLLTATAPQVTAPRSKGPRSLVLAAIVLQGIAGLALGLPGHLSEDSIVQLYEARSLQFISFQPPMMSLLLRVLDGWVRGTALFVVLDQLLLTASFALLFAQRKSELRWPAAVVIALVVLNPLLLAYTGIVWKDVLMAHLAAFGYVCLYAGATQAPRGARIAWALAAVLALALAASLRQHALVLALPGAVYAAFLLVGGRAARWVLALVLCAMVAGINVAIIAYADAVAVGGKIPRMGVGLRSLARFDLTGIAAHGGVIPDTAVAAQVETAQVPFYTPLRIDTLPDPVHGSPIWQMETAQLLALWGRSILNSPRAYALHRTANFEALLWRSGMAPLCVAIQIGVVPAVYVPFLGRDVVPELGIARDLNQRDRGLEYWFIDWRGSVLFNHAFWSIVLAGAAAILALRGGAAALVVFATSVLVFALGFGVIGMSCEFRYIYVLPVAATLLTFALAATGRSW